MRRVGYDCDAFNKMCVAQPGGQGTYGTLGDCQADCGPMCFVPEMTGPFITEDGFWHPGRPVHGSPCSKKLVPWENIREDPSNPYHLPCMSRGECETAFNPVNVPMAGMGALASCVPEGGTCHNFGKTCCEPYSCAIEHAGGQTGTCKHPFAAEAVDPCSGAQPAGIPGCVYQCGEYGTCCKTMSDCQNHYYNCEKNLPHGEYPYCSGLDMVKKTHRG